MSDAREAGLDPAGSSGELWQSPVLRRFGTSLVLVGWASGSLALGAYVGWSEIADPTWAQFVLGLVSAALFAVFPVGFAAAAAFSLFLGLDRACVVIRVRSRRPAGGQAVYGSDLVRPSAGRAGGRRPS